MLLHHGAATWRMTVNRLLLLCYVDIERIYGRRPRPLCSHIVSNYDASGRLVSPKIIEAQKALL